MVVYISYKGDYTFGTVKKTIAVNFLCAGTLITPSVVMSAGHCKTRSFGYNYNGKYFSLPIAPNAYYPTWASMYTVYAGVSNISFLETNQSPTLPGVAIKVSNVTVVCIFNTLK